MKPRHPIKLMPPRLALQIAAGEVVERPASAVKELIDNAIDAGATQIAIEVREAGLKLLRVTDNGHGIRRDELPLAFTSHATSKIDDVADLENLTTLGFRGEALPSLAAVSRVEVQTRTEDEPAGTEYRLDAGQAGDIRPCAAPRGVRITVADLFANVPARRKFVRSQRAESGQIQTVVQRYALAQPQIQFSLTIDGATIFTSPGTGLLADAIAAVHGPHVIAGLLPLDSDGQSIRVTGLASAPSLTRSNRTALDIFVNGRPVANRSLQFALEEAYRGFLMTGRHPLAAVHLTLEPRDVDANIHPSKSEVRFAREREVHGALYRAVSSALLEMRLRESTGTPALEHGAFSLPEDVSQSELPLPSRADERENELAPLLEGLPALRVFGQANNTFIIAEGPAGLYMIDQHAAHERILFDTLETQLARGVVQSQQLLEPLPLHLTAEQMLALEDGASLLAEAGFSIEPFGHDTCLIRGLPALLGRGGTIDLVTDVLDELSRAPSPTSGRDRALAAMACKGAVRAGDSLDTEEMREIVVQLERTLRPATCPHGRPTMIHLSHSQLEREFGRR